MRKNIIQSKTEPNKNDIWLSEEGLKKYGKNGWEPLGGGGINDSTPVGAKEVLYVDITNIHKEGSFIMSYDDYKNHIVYFTVTQGNITYSAEKVFSNCVDYYGSVVYTDTYLFRNNVGNISDDYPAKTMLFVVNVNVNDNQVNLGSISQVNQIIPFGTGDGTKFLSDDGTYKEVSGGSGPVIIELDVVDFTSNGYNCNDSEVQAILNYNVLFKMTNYPLDNINTLVLRPYSYMDSDEGLIIGMFAEMNTDSSSRAVLLLKDNKLTKVK